MCAAAVPQAESPPAGTPVRVGGKIWRQALREWLSLLGSLRGARGLHRWTEVQRAVALQLGDVEPGVQVAALGSLKVGGGD